jgi:diguanylate cyclase (GGDEF)-like protein
MAQIRALVIDDDPSIHRQVEEALCPRIVDTVLTHGEPSDAIRMALADPPDVILLDVNMPVMDGFKVCQLLKENLRTRDVPIIFITVDTNVVHLARALDCGAADWIRKPVNSIELQARVRVTLREKAMVDLLKEQARIDALTGLHNRSAIDDALAAAASAWDRNRTPVGLLMLDLDHFKRVNDDHGHGVGDEMLRAVGMAIRKCCRPYDTPCRFGGDEFAVILNQTAGDAAVCAAARLRESIDRVEVVAGDTIVRPSTSAGLATTAGLDRSFEPSELLEAADAALYQAKDAGRDQLVVAAPRWHRDRS